VLRFAVSVDTVVLSVRIRKADQTVKNTSPAASKVSCGDLVGPRLTGESGVKNNKTVAAICHSVQCQHMSIILTNFLTVQRKLLRLYLVIKIFLSKS